MSNLQSAVRTLLDETRVSGSNASDVLLHTIAIGFGMWLMPVESESLIKKNSHTEVQQQSVFRDLIIGRLCTSDPVEENAFSMLYSKDLPVPVFEAAAHICRQLHHDRLLMSDFLDCLTQTYLEQFHEIHQTPAWLNRLAVSILAPVNGKFYDGVAGVCDTVFEALRFSRERNGDLQAFAQEINPTLHAISILRSRVKQLSFRQACGDSIISPKFHENEKSQTFDFSIMFPLVGNISTVSREDFEHRKDLYDLSDGKSIGSDWLFVFHQLASLNPKGKGISCIFNGSLFNERDRGLRKKLLEMNVLDAIISLPAYCLPFTAAPISLLLLNKNRKEADAVAMIDGSKWIESGSALGRKRIKGPSDVILNELITVIRKKVTTDGSIFVDVSVLTEDNLLPKQYSRLGSTTILTKDFGSIQIIGVSKPDWIPLKEVVQIYRGINTATAIKSERGDGVGIIKLSDVQDDRLCLNTIEQYSFQKAIKQESYQVRPNDILLSCKGAAVKLCIVPADCGSLLLSLHFLGLRVNEEVFDPRYLLRFLQSPVGYQAIVNRQMGSSIVMLRAKDIEEIQIPYMPVSKQKDYIEQLQEEENHIQAQIKELQQMERQAKWDFYALLGLTDIMTREDEYE